jgi:hypothetical protein
LERSSALSGSSAGRTGPEQRGFRTNGGETSRESSVHGFRISMDILRTVIVREGTAEGINVNAAI